MSRRKAFFLGALGAAAAGLVGLAVLFAALHSPAVLNRLANAFGYEVRVESIRLSPALSGSLSGLAVRRLDDGMMLAASSVSAATSLPGMLRGEVDSLVLESPTLTYRIGSGESGDLDTGFLSRLPDVRRLDVRNARVSLTFAGDPSSRVELRNAGLTVRDYSARTAGTVAFHADFALAAAGEAPLSADGTLGGRLEVTGGSPHPDGRGTIEVAVRSGTGRAAALSGLTGAADLGYDRRTATLTLSALRGESKGFGRIQATGQAVLRGEVPWSASVSAGPIDFAQAFALLRPLVPETYRAWTMQGEGAVDTRVRGTYAAGRLSIGGDVTFSFSQAGVSSPDGSKAAQALGGKVIMRLQYAAPEARLSFDVEAEHRAGEYLWGAYYENLVGQRASLAARGAVAWDGAPRTQVTGTLDAFQTGEYSLSGDGTGRDWVWRFKVADVSHARILNLLLREHLPRLAPALAGLSITGASSLEGVLRAGPEAADVAGTYRMTGTNLEVPALPLVVRGIEAELPFDLRYPAPANAPATWAAPAFVHLDGARAGRVEVDRLRIPLQIGQNAIEMPGTVAIPLLGGHLRLSGLRLDDVLRPGRARVDVVVRDVDLAAVTGWLIGAEYPGRIDADLGAVSYEAGRIQVPGRAVVRVFGGEVEAANVFAENLASPARRAGADLTFRHISLDEVTRTVGIGRMSGIVQGSLRHLVMEGDQPASAVLEVESVPTDGVEQWISVDAIQNISILGTGAGSVLKRGITQFFERYPYSRIGIRCVLKDDQFSVRGTIHEGGTEYLVRRAFLRGVDVVNQNPDNVISFKDMRERLARIGRPAGPDGIEVR